jgi:CubicO group peptidase (beta-lactamase class C family)
MKRGFQYLAIFALMFLLSNCEKKTQNIIYDSRYKKEIAEIRKEASIYMMLNNIPGASFAISKDEKIIYSEGIGLASKDLEVPATRKTKFRIGELSELFTALIYQMMMEGGTLYPDSTVQHYLPDFPESDFKGYNYKITLNQLVNHSSGIREQNKSEQSWSGANVTLQNSLDNFKNESLDSEPGWYQSQSSSNYLLLGAIMEKASGKHFPDLLKEYLTDTLKLLNTEVDNPFRTVIGRTDFFDFNLVAQVVNSTFRDMRYRAPADGILSNAEDLVRFGNAILYSELISNKIKERIFVPTDLLGEFPPTIANGWIVQKNKNDEFYYGKVGGVTGGGAVLLLIPAKKIVIAITVNLTSSEEIPVFRIFNPFLQENSDDN